MPDGFPACTDWAKSQDLDPIGSAGSYDGFLLVEQPLPWPADVSEIPELAEVAKVASAARLRLQAVARVGSADDGPGRRLICYRSSRPGWAGPMVRTEGIAEPGALGDAALVDGALADVARADVARALADVARAIVEGAGDATGPLSPGDADVLVCTHGRRDSCCGARGMELLGTLAGAPSFGRPGVRLWRTSHTGGHRFAPTAVVLPSATLWAWADAKLLAQIVDAEGPASLVLPRYRGCACLATSSHQAVEKAVLAEVGWPLLSAWRRGVDLGEGLVRLETESAGTWEAVAKIGRRVPQPDCRTDPELAFKQNVEWVVEGLTQVVAA